MEVDGGKPWEIAWGELRGEGARWKRRQGGRKGNRGKYLGESFLSVHPVVGFIRSLPTDLSPSYVPRFPLCPPSRHFRIAPSRQVQLNENPSIEDAFGKRRKIEEEELRLSCYAGLQLNACKNCDKGGF